MSLPDKALSKCIFVLWLGSLLDLRVPLVVREKKVSDSNQNNGFCCTLVPGTAMSQPDKILSKCILVLWLGSLLDVPLVVREKKAVNRQQRTNSSGRPSRQQALVLKPIEAKAETSHLQFESSARPFPAACLDFQPVGQARQSWPGLGWTAVVACTASSLGCRRRRAAVQGARIHSQVGSYISSFWHLCHMSPKDMCQLVCFNYYHLPLSQYAYKLYCIFRPLTTLFPSRAF